MTSELRPRLVVDGQLEEIMGTCVNQAEKTFRERWGQDTNPMIVQMIHGGKPIDHWYYRSDQWISQPYVWPATFLQPYEGPVNLAIPLRYGPETFIFGDDERLITENLIEELSK